MRWVRSETKVSKHDSNWRSSPKYEAQISTPERLRAGECSPPMTCYNGRHLGRSDQNGNNNFHVGTSGYLRERRKAEEEICSVFCLIEVWKNEWI